MTIIYIGIPEDEKVKPEDLMCHVCNGMTDAQCDDPFGKYDESGTHIHHDKFQKKCNDPNVKKELGFEGKTATMCRKIYQDGKKLYN